MRYRISLSKKMTIIIVLISTLLTGVAVVVGYSTYANTMDDHYRRLSLNVARTAATYIDPEIITTYLDSLEKDEKYYEMLAELFNIKNNNDVLWLYVIKVDGPNAYYIMDAETDEELACALGEHEYTSEVILPFADRLEEGVPSIITNGEYGWLISSYTPVINSQGKAVALVGVDISMDKVMADRRNFLFMLCGGMSVIVLLSITGALFLTGKYITTPINALAQAAGDFVSGKTKAANGQASAISKLNIKTGDEIENLSTTIQVMENDINEYIENITRITAEKERIGAELTVATQIQASMLPCIFPPFPSRDEFDIFASMKPAKEVGGDFYDFFLINEKRLGVVIADVSGKGVPAALFMVIAKTLIKNHTQIGLEPSEVLTVVNDQLCENNEAGMFVTAFMGILEVDTGRFVYANAGHNYPLFYQKDKGYQWLVLRPGLPLACMDGIKYGQGEMILSPGDRMFLYTDGVTEAIDCDDNFFGDDRLFEALNKKEVESMELKELIEYMKDRISLFAGKAEQADDITMLALEFWGMRSV